MQLSYLYKNSNENRVMSITKCSLFLWEAFLGTQMLFRRTVYLKILYWKKISVQYWIHTFLLTWMQTGLCLISVSKFGWQLIYRIRRLPFKVQILPNFPFYPGGSSVPDPIVFGFRIRILQLNRIRIRKKMLLRLLELQKYSIIM